MTVAGVELCAVLLSAVGVARLDTTTGVVCRLDEIKLDDVLTMLLDESVPSATMGVDCIIDIFGFLFTFVFGLLVAFAFAGLDTTFTTWLVATEAVMGVAAANETGMAAAVDGVWTAVFR